MKTYRRINTMILSILLASLVGTMVFGSLTLQSHANAITSNKNNNSKVAMNITLTPNQIAAGGPIPPNYTLIEQEQKCVTKEGNNGGPWYPTLLGYEHHDSNRTKLYDCATFTGSFTSPNSVYAYKSPDTIRYYTPSMMTTRGTNEMYIYGGALYNAVPPPSGSYVARIEPGSLKELWRTNLVNTNTLMV